MHLTDLYDFVIVHIYYFLFSDWQGDLGEIDQEIEPYTPVMIAFKDDKKDKKNKK
jgi:hypothetical protein